MTKLRSGTSPRRTTPVRTPTPVKSAPKSTSPTVEKQAESRPAAEETRAGPVPDRVRADARDQARQHEAQLRAHLVDRPGAADRPGSTASKDDPSGPVRATRRAGRRNFSLATTAGTPREVGGLAHAANAGIGRQNTLNGGPLAQATPPGAASAAAAAGAAAGAPGEGFRTNTDGSHTFRGTSEDDSYTVTQEASGDLVVTNDTSGDAYTLPAADVANGVRIWTGGGDDQITVDGSVRADLTLHGGTGNDTIDARDARGDLDIGGGLGDDEIRGGSGDDIIDGHSGEDRIYGGDGDDEIDGGNGNDRIFGGDGMDLVEGGRGDDQLFGGAGNDQVQGQAGDDWVSGGAGDDLVMGGDGRDTLRGATGSDAIYADADDAAIDAGAVYDPSISGIAPDAEHDLIVAEDGAPAATNVGANDVRVDYDPAEVEQYLTDHPELNIQGSDEFVARTQADIGAMLQTNQGRDLLDELTTQLAANGETIDFVEKEEGPGGSYNHGSNQLTVGNWAATYGDGGSRHPLPVLFHELAHAYQDLIGLRPSGETQYPGGTIRNSESQVTGFPWIDASGNTRAGDEHPYTDNKFRDELGLPGRSEYGGVEGVNPSAHVP